MKKSIFSVGIIALAIAIPLSLYVKVSHAHPAVKQEKPKPVNVKVAKATELVIPKTISSVGHIRAIKSVALSFEADGQISKIYKQAGRVKKGDLLATLKNATDLAQLKSDTATLRLATSTYQRYLKLAKAGDESKQVLEQKKEAMVTAQAAVDKDKATLKQKVLRAPFDGVLGSTDYSVGAYLAKGTPLFNLVQLAPVKARYSIPVSLKNELEIGQAVTVTNDTNKDKTFKGIVSFISPNVNASSGTITIDATLQNPDYLLSPGMFVSIEQVLDPNRKLLMIPDIALMTDVKGRYVFLVNGNTVQKVYVKVGEITDNLSAITSGLKAGDIVVTAGQQRLEDKDQINIIGHMKTALSKPQSDSSKSEKMVVNKNKAKPATPKGVPAKPLSSSSKSKSASSSTAASSNVTPNLQQSAAKSLNAVSQHSAPKTMNAAKADESPKTAKPAKPQVKATSSSSSVKTVHID